MSKITLLAIDDDLTAGPLIRAVLKDRFDVIIENSGARAISRAREVKPQVILLDLNMPNVDGYEVLRQFKQHPEISIVPVICMSGAIDQESRTRAVELGAVGYLQKPLDIKNLSNDAYAMLEGLNVELASEDRKRRFTIAFNTKEKYRLMRKNLWDTCEAGGKALVLSLKPGADFSTPELDPLLRSGAFCFLQASPSLISKFPFLQDVSPVVEDIRGFLAGASSDYQLFFDDPHVMVNLQDPTAAIGRLYALKAALTAEFDQVWFYASRDQAAASSTILSELAQVFCQ